MWDGNGDDNMCIVHLLFIYFFLIICIYFSNNILVALAKINENEIFALLFSIEFELTAWHTNLVMYQEYFKFSLQ